MVRIDHIEEPNIDFGSGRHIDPKLGITAFGPKSDNPRNIQIGLIGSGSSIQKARDWVNDSKSKIKSSDELIRNPPFPGMNRNSVWGCSIEIQDEAVSNISASEIERICAIRDKNERIGNAAKKIANKFRAITSNTPTPDVVFFAVPEKLNKYCGKGVKGAREAHYKKSETLLKSIHSQEQKKLGKYTEGAENGEKRELAVDLRRAIKARILDEQKPLQIILESTLDGGYQDKSRFAWNFWSAQYYKANGLPWTLQGSDKLTCYIGISFYEDIVTKDRHVAVSQVFSSSTGEGIVIEGQEQVEKRNGHLYLDEEQSKKLVKSSVAEFEDNHGGDVPKRLVIHKRGPLSDEEVRGIEKVVDDRNIEFRDIVSVRRNNKGIRFYRHGDYPPVRGTYCQLNESVFLLFTTGYSPFLETYEGSRRVSPKLIELTKCDSSLKQIAEEIMALSKISWNNADLNNSEPLTLDFSEKVGKILSEKQGETGTAENFRFFM